MNGTAHAAIGAGVGISASFIVNAEPTLMTTLIATGAISALVPDLDTKGKLANRITLSDSILKIISLLMAIGVIGYTFMQEGPTWHKILGIILGVSIILLTRKLSSKIMLLITGIAVIITGYLTSTLWVLLLGVYISIASLLPHRSYTHSIIGLLFFGYIAYEFTNSLNLANVVMFTAIVGYISHLLADSRYLPTNRQGVKLLLPFSKTQF